MHVRFYIDPASEAPHIYQHGVSETEVEEVLAAQAKIGRVETVPGSRLAEHMVGVFFA